MTGQGALPCKTMFGATRGSEMVELVERTTGDLCPCKRGLACPLLPVPPREPAETSA